MVYQIGGLITGEVAFNPFTVVAFIVLLIVVYLLVRPDPNKRTHEKMTAAYAKE